MSKLDEYLSVEEWTEMAAEEMDCATGAATSSCELGLVEAAIRQGEISDEVNPEQAATAVMALHMRGQVAPRRLPRIAVRAASRILRYQGYRMKIPPEDGQSVKTLLEAIGSGKQLDDDLADVIRPFITKVETEAQTEDPAVRIFISAPVTNRSEGDDDLIKKWHGTVDRAAIDAGLELDDPVKIYTTLPSQISRSDEAAFDASRNALWGERKDGYGSDGLIVIGLNGGGTGIGIELMLAGSRCPVLWLQPDGSPLPPLVGGLKREADITVKKFENDAQLGHLVKTFIQTKASAFLNFKRLRYDAAQQNFQPLLRLRHAWENLDWTEHQALSVRLNMSPKSIENLLNDSRFISRLNHSEIRGFAAQLRVAFYDLLKPDRITELAPRQTQALITFSNEQRLSGETTLLLEKEGVHLLNDPQARTTLTEPSDWASVLEDVAK